MNKASERAIFSRLFSTTNERLLELLKSAPERNVLPSTATLAHAVKRMPASLPSDGLGLEATTEHILADLMPAVSSSSLSPRYFGFVTGGVTPAARLADYVVSTLDECLAVRLPAETVATDVENRASSMLAELLYLDTEVWTGIFTPGSSTSNLNGMACGREYLLECRGAPMMADRGLVAAYAAAGIEEIQILSCMAHPSVLKAASLLGLGRYSVQQIGHPQEPWRTDFFKLENALKVAKRACIVSVSCGEVNTGKFGTNNKDMQRVRSLCDKYKAWLHVDAAFGVFTRALPYTEEYAYLHECTRGIELADSISGDGHKLLNVPFDCGFFFTRHAQILKTVFSVPKGKGADFAIPPVYFTTPPPSVGVSSPTDTGIQNARRFRALPAYASLTAYGRSGYEDMLARVVQLTRGIAAHVWDHASYELLPKLQGRDNKKSVLETVFMLITFRARNPKLNGKLLQKINGTNRMYGSGIVWEGEPAVRLAVANCAVDVERDLAIVKGVLDEIAGEERSRL